jgi:hypothetical protein
MEKPSDPRSGRWVVHPCLLVSKIYVNSYPRSSLIKLVNIASFGIFLMACFKSLNSVPSFKLKQKTSFLLLFHDVQHMLLF